jgi:hypothetical protein
MSSVDIPFATRLTTSETVIRIPRMQARPPITAGSNVILSNIRLIYQREERSESPMRPRACATRTDSHSQLKPAYPLLSDTPTNPPPNSRRRHAKPALEL